MSTPKKVPLPKKTFHPELRLNPELLRVIVSWREVSQLYGKAVNKTAVLSFNLQIAEGLTQERVSEKASFNVYETPCNLTNAED